MNRLRSGLVPILVAAAFLLTTPLLAQVRQRPTGQARPTMPTVAFVIGGDYYNPAFTDVDAVYSTIERNSLLPAGNNFKSYYNVLAALRLTPVEGQSVQAEASGSVLKTVNEGSTNYLQLYYFGGSYLVHFPMTLVAPYVGAGAGYEWLSTERSYATRSGVARVNAQLVQLHGIVGVEYFSESGMSVALEGRYGYATSIAPGRRDLDITLKGITGGIHIGVPLTSMQ